MSAAEDEVSSLTAVGSAAAGRHAAASFTTTHWSVVLEAQGETPAAQRALEILCRTYWRPIYSFVRQQGVGPEAAEDLTQAFFALLLERKGLDRPFAALNADPAVMEFFASPQSRESSDASIDAWQRQFATQGWSNWAVEELSTRQFIGFIGLSVPRRILPFSPCIEVGWRLARASWGKGFATEGARAALRVGFERLRLAEIVSFTAVKNVRSRAVMERIGMQNAHQDFEHPGIPEGHQLRLHCLYRIRREHWEQNAA